MAFDEKLADRIRAIVGKDQRVAEKRMFGGVSWMLNANMFVGVAKDELMVRVGPDAHDAALREPHVRIMDFTGRPMRGYVFVGAAALKTDEALAKWIERGTKFVATLPAKKQKTRSR
jgi:TfoX/Sxy family transcriptional regulator of competence genes